MVSVSDYYMTAALYEPPFFKNREFGFMLPGMTTMTRHKAFSSIEKLRTYLIEHAPIQVYFSSSKYEFPDTYPMEDKKKGWMGQDLVFDIDDDHLKKATLKEARRQADKLVSILEDQFGLKKILLASSGRRGFHAHAHDDCVQKLGKPERREITEAFGHYRIWKSRKIVNPNWVEIDPVVTPDAVRLIGLPGALNIKNGTVGERVIIKSY